MKKNYASKETIKISLFLFLLCLFSNACYEDKEGCLDVQATNFDVEADVDCCKEEPCCCTYPTLQIEVRHKLIPDSTDNFALNQALTLDSMHYFVVEDMTFFLSNLRLIDSSTGVEIGINNTITLEVSDNGMLRIITIEDNFSIIKKTNFRYTIGDFTPPHTYDQVRFDVGIAGLANHTIIDSLLNTHPLHNTTDSLHINPEEGYIFNKINLYRDTSALTPLTSLEIKTLVPIELSFSAPQLAQAGFDSIIFLRINYLEWFKGINFVEDTENQLVTKIEENTNDVFQLIEQ